MCAHLPDADLTGADLSGANLTRANLSGADLTGANLNETVFGDIDLTRVNGLNTCEHRGPSMVGYRTLKRSKSLPLSFIRGVGVPESLIDYLPSLLNQGYYSCFISYSSRDDDFATRIHADLQNSGVRCWFASQDLLIGTSYR
jgi:uncharacterized protein YjbI with pentapeptide repeats